MTPFPDTAVLVIAEIFIFSLFSWFSLAQALPGLDYFITPFISTLQPASASIFSVPYGVFGAVTWAFILFALHAVFRRKLFGASLLIDDCHPLARRIHAIGETMGVRVARIFRTDDKGRLDAVAFGSGDAQTLLVGYRLSALAGIDPKLFTAIVTHELSHFLNGDVKAVFLCRSFFISSIVLTITTVLSFAIAPFRLIIMNFYAFDNINVWLNYQGLNNLRSWANSFSGQMFTHGVYMSFWIVVTWLELLAFIRTRELMADLRASDFIGLEDMQRLLKAAGSTRRSIWLEISHFFKAHPTTKKRLAVLAQPNLLAIRSPVRYAVLGFAYGETLRSAIRINDSLPAMFPKLMEGLGVGSHRIEELINGSNIVASSVFYTLGNLPDILFLLAALSIVGCDIALKLEERSLLSRARRLTVACIAFGLGGALAEAFDPFGHYAGAGRVHVVTDISFVYGLSWDNMGLFEGAELLLTSIFMCCARICGTERSHRRWPAFAGFFLVLSSYLISVQLVGIAAIEKILGVQVLQYLREPQYWEMLAVYVTAWVVCTLVIRRNDLFGTRSAAI